LLGSLLGMGDYLDIYGSYLVDIGGDWNMNGKKNPFSWEVRNPN